MRFSVNTGLRCEKAGVGAMQTLSDDRFITLFQRDIWTRYVGQVFLKKPDVQIALIFTNQDPTNQDDRQDDDPKASGTCGQLP
ncbi:hypothetical protein EV677_0898 [Herminiimonas fonticola]|uniref:Uncharacterized protein n=1 Tax=Herminiimonas fonticola TaxID=303380 RepID=A0A4R6GJ85_9BURK|nr:hypothetical protein Hfont_0872 [Herminiimonas fonticola]TDN94354.1 hypothetical protein EV677_0898 [Herminiimonas fonticola]